MLFWFLTAKIWIHGTPLMSFAYCLLTLISNGDCFIFCQKEFLDKYESFAQLVAKIYPSENIPSVAEMRDLLASM